MIVRMLTIRRYYPQLLIGWSRIFEMAGSYTEGPAGSYRLLPRVDAVFIGVVLTVPPRTQCAIRR
jgi:hypothetical protein